MDIIEIRNNLVKISYNGEENPQLGHFLALTSENKSYVAQFVNLKSDNLNNFAVAKLLFTFTSDGVVNNYDGSIPTTSYNIIDLPADELLGLLPVETPIKIGNLANSTTMLNVDISFFEHNPIVFVNNDLDKKIIITNFVRQLFRLKEKSIIIDIDGIFSDYQSYVIGKDFKLPLNNTMINYIFDYELSDVDNNTKAIIHDIFYAVTQYISTLDKQFLPISKFIDVVTSQYKETQMPELALLKNKLIKYQQAGIFADEPNEFECLKDKFSDSNCVVLNLKNINDVLQKEAITYIHKVLDKINDYVYFFAPLNDENTDKKLIKTLINNNHIFTTILVSHSCKYSTELKNHAQEIILFAPQDLVHDFAPYNTFLNKLNMQEFVIYGTLTHGVPMIIALEDLDLDLTKDDVFGDKKVFIPNNGVQASDNNNNKTKFNQSIDNSEQTVVQSDNNSLSETIDESQQDNNVYNTTYIQPIENILDNDEYDEPEEEFTQDLLTEDDLDMIESNQDDIDVNIDLSDAVDEDSSVVVPVYNPDDEEGVEVSGDEIGYNKGDKVTHPRYGQGTVEKIIKYGNKTLCSINFDNVGRRLLDPSISEFEHD